MVWLQQSAVRKTGAQRLQQSALLRTGAKRRYLDAVIHVLSIEIQVARSLPHVCLGHVGCVQQLVAILEMMLLHTRAALPGCTMALKDSGFLK